MPKNPESVGVQFPESKEGEETEKIMLELQEFVENNPAEFTEEDEEKLMDDYAELEKRGLRGVAHFIHRGSPTGDWVTESLPKAWVEKFCQRIHVLPDDKDVRMSISSKLREGDETVYMGEDGSISGENADKLESLLRDRVGILLGGGPGTPKDAFYVPLLHALEQELKKKTSGAGICLGHQLWGELMLHMQRKEGKGVVPGYFEAITTVEEVTPEGKKNPVFARLGNEFTVATFNQFHLMVSQSEGDVRDYGKVMTRSKATGYPSSLSLNAEVPDQVITTQRHPEIGMLGQRGEILLQDQELVLPSGNKIIVPKGLHPHILALAGYFIEHYDELAVRYGFSEKDVQDLFSKERMSKHLDKDFYGPLLSYMAKQRLEQ